MTTPIQRSGKNGQKWYKFIDLEQWAIILTGLFMLGVFDLTDYFVNPISSIVFHLTQGIYYFSCFIFIFFKLAIRLKWKFAVIKEVDNQTEEVTEEEIHGVEEEENANTPNIIKEKQPLQTKVQQPMEVKSKYVDAFYIVLKFITIGYIITIILSAGYYLYNTIYYKKTHITVNQFDVLTIDKLLSNKGYTQSQILDSVNERFPKPIFFSVGKVTSMRLDTSGAFVYYYTLHGKIPLIMPINEMKIKIYNFTKCKERMFCNCDSTNICLKDKKIELFYFLVKRKTKKGERADTAYYSRILQ